MTVMEQHESDLRRHARQRTARVTVSLPSKQQGISRPAKWPLWARIASRFRTNGDRGVGDTIEHWQGIMGSDQFKVWHLAVFGTLKTCPQCPARWNRQFPYEQPPPFDGLQQGCCKQIAGGSICAPS